jgi:hypothetical protein
MCVVFELEQVFRGLRRTGATVAWGKGMRMHVSLFVAGVALSGCAPLPRSGDACYANAYSQPGFEGTETTYTGPTYERVFMQHARSLAVGDGARLEGFADPAFAHETLYLAPGARVSDLRRLGLHARVSAIKLECVG